MPHEADSPIATECIKSRKALRSLIPNGHQEIFGMDATPNDTAVQCLVDPLQTLQLLALQRVRILGDGVVFGKLEQCLRINHSGVILVQRHIRRAAAILLAAGYGMRQDATIDHQIGNFT